jgi:hypothetical protein
MPMKRVWGYILGGAVILAGSGIAVSACTHDDSTIFIRNALAPQLVTNGQACLFTTDPTQPYISTGTLDIDFSYGYGATFLVGNQLVPQGDPSSPKTETSYVNIQGATVRTTDAAGKALPGTPTFTRLTSATIAPSAGTTVSYEPISITLIGGTTIQDLIMAGQLPDVPPAGQPLRATRGIRLITYVRFFGTTLGGQYVESNEFEYPVDICRGCLIQFAPQDIKPGCSVPNCFGMGMGGSLPVPCRRGHDLPIDCSQCLDVQDCYGAAPPGTCGTGDAGAGGG